jgi:hypothetical protein
MRMIETFAEAWRERSSERRALTAPRAVPEARLARSRIGAAVEARLAVRAGVRLDDFLRNRLAKYAARLPVTLEDLPIEVEIAGGEAVIRQKPPSRTAGAPRTAPAERTTASALVAVEGPYAAREIRDAEAALDALDARADAARVRIDETSRAYADAVAAGAVVVHPDLEATPEQLGRPPVPAATPILALRAFVAALLVAEAWRFAGPVLDLSGIAAAELEAALQVSPLPTALALAFAVGAAAAVFAFAGVALARATDAVDDAPAPRRRALLGAAGFVSALAAGGAAAAATAPQRWAHVILLVTVPFAAALLWRGSSHLARVRAGALDAALAWDRERAREAVERGRHGGLVAAAEAELAEIEAERLLARRRLRALHRRAVDAERHAVVVARAEARRTDRLCEGLASALELDRYLYIRLSSERAHAPVERPVRAGRLEPAVATERLGIVG